MYEQFERLKAIATRMEKTKVDSFPMQLSHLKEIIAEFEQLQSNSKYNEPTEAVHKNRVIDGGRF